MIEDNRWPKDGPHAQCKDENDRLEAEVAAVKAELAEAKGELNSEECDSAFWEQRAKKAEAEVERLTAWKAEARAVETTWDKQKVGELLGLLIGDNILRNIQPGIEKLLAEVERLTAELDRFRDGTHDDLGKDAYHIVCIEGIEDREAEVARLTAELAEIPCRSIAHCLADLRSDKRLPMCGVCSPCKARAKGEK